MQELLQRLGVELNYTREILVFALILARTMPMVIQTPFLGGKLAPPEVKIGLGAAIAVLLWPVARTAAGDNVPFTPIAFLLLMMKEVFIGMAIGFVNSHIFTIMEMAGRLIDTARGSSMAEVLVPHSQQRATPFGDMYYQLLLVIFIVMGGHHIFFEAFFFSFASIPLTVGLPAMPQFAEFTDYMIRLTADVFLASVLLASPVVAATLITDAVFGILNRVAPQLNAYFMAMPVKATGGVIISLVVMNAFVARLSDYVVWSLRTVERTLDLLVLK